MSSSTLVSSRSFARNPGANLLHEKVVRELVPCATLHVFRPHQTGLEQLAQKVPLQGRRRHL